MNSLLLEFSGKITEKDIYRSSNLDISEEYILKIVNVPPAKGRWLRVSA